MAGAQETCPLSVQEAKERLLAEDPEPTRPAGAVMGWVGRHPGEAVLAAAGLGLAFVVFPRLRRLAVPAAIALIRLTMR